MHGAAAHGTFNCVQVRRVRRKHHKQRPHACQLGLDIFHDVNSRVVHDDHASSIAVEEGPQHGQLPSGKSWSSACARTVAPMRATHQAEANETHEKVAIYGVPGQQLCAHPLHGKCTHCRKPWVIAQQGGAGHHGSLIPRRVSVRSAQTLHAKADFVNENELLRAELLHKSDVPHAPHRITLARARRDLCAVLATRTRSVARAHTIPACG